MCDLQHPRLFPALCDVLTRVLGNIHVVIVCPQDDKEKGERVITEIQKLAIQMEGTVTGEHGVGLALRDKLVDELGSDTIDTMRKVRPSSNSSCLDTDSAKIKLALDPQCILNCDKVFRMDESFPGSSFA